MTINELAQMVCEIGTGSWCGVQIWGYRNPEGVSNFCVSIGDPNEAEHGAYTPDIGPVIGDNLSAVLDELERFRLARERELYPALADARAKGDIWIPPDCKLEQTEQEAAGED